MYACICIFEEKLIVKGFKRFIYLHIHIHT